MPACYSTHRPFDDLAVALPEIVSNIDRGWFSSARWLQRKDAAIERVSPFDWAVIAKEEGLLSIMVVLEVRFSGAGEPRERLRELYNVPLVIAMPGLKASEPPLVNVHGPRYAAEVYDATATPAFAGAVLDGMRGSAQVASERGFIEFQSVRSGPMERGKTATKSRGDTTNTIVTVNSSQVIKVYRRMVPGLSQDIEIGLRLTQAGFCHVAAVTGYALYRERGAFSYPLLSVQEFVPHRDDAWEMCREDARRFLRGEGESGREGSVGDERRRRRRLGTITAKLHTVLAGIDGDAFEPERIRREDILELVEKAARCIDETMESLRRAEGRYELRLAERIGLVVAQEASLRAGLQRAYGRLASSRSLGRKIRIHGDLHLGQFLRVCGNGQRDFVVIDFEGEPLRPLEARRRKSSPLRDVAGMLRSFSYAGQLSALELQEAGRERDEGPAAEGMRNRRRPVIAANEWSVQAGKEFLAGYLREIRRSCGDLLPQDPRDLHALLACFKLEKALYEVRYELGNRPGWIEIPLQGVLDCLSEMR